MKFLKFFKLRIILGLAIGLLIFLGLVPQLISLIGNNNGNNQSLTTQINPTDKVKAVPVNLNSNAASPLGTNLSGIADWSTQHPFLDAFKSSRQWATQCGEGVSGCPWNTQENKYLDLDANGWVKSLPSPTDTRVKFRRVESVVFADPYVQKKLGRYVIFYDGEGSLSYSFAKKDENLSRPGRDVIEVSPKPGDPLILAINSTDPNKRGNYIRNIRIIKESDLNLYEQGEIFNPQFLAKIKKFKTLRFMDWMLTNNSTQKEWSNRPLVTDYSWRIKGVPIEVMVALANKLKTDAWFNMPHQATDDYVYNFAQLVKKSLDPKLKVYVEYSNELWNWGFQQAQYANQQGRARWGDIGDAFMQWNGMKASQFCSIWKEVYGQEKNRVKCVIATQTAYHTLEKNLLNCPLWVAEGHPPCYQNMDVYAITAYLSGNLGEPNYTNTVAGWMREKDGGFSKAVEQLRSGNLLDDKFSLPGIKRDTIYHRQIAKDKGLQLVSYEAGQHIVGWGGTENNEKVTNFFIELNKRKEMYDLYRDLLNIWKDSGGTLFMNFTDIGGGGKYGSWGALETVDQDGSPKYNALIDFIGQNACWWDNCIRED